MLVDAIAGVGRCDAPLEVYAEDPASRGAHRDEADVGFHVLEGVLATMGAARENIQRSSLICSDSLNRRPSHER